MVFKPYYLTDSASKTAVLLPILLSSLFPGNKTPSLLVGDVSENHWLRVFRKFL